MGAVGLKTRQHSLEAIRMRTCPECMGAGCEWCGEPSNTLEEFCIDGKIVVLCQPCAKEQRQKEIEEMGELVEELY